MTLVLHKYVVCTFSYLPYCIEILQKFHQIFEPLRDLQQRLPKTLMKITPANEVSAIFNVQLTIVSSTVLSEVPTYRERPCLWPLSHSAVSTSPF